MVKVLKFGGTSLASAEQFQKVAEIIKAGLDFAGKDVPGQSG